MSLHTANPLEAQLRSHPYLSVVQSIKQVQQELSYSKLNQEQIHQKFDDLLRHSPTSKTILSNSQVINTSCSLNELMDEFIRIKTGKREWRDKTARYNIAMLNEFILIVGNRQIAQVDRTSIENYLVTIGSIPKNRKKLYPDSSISELVEMDFTEDQLPTSKTIKDKFHTVGAFLSWCVGKDLLLKNPCDNINIKSTSKSYAPFDDSDLKRLFSCEAYKNAKHSWQHWLPLMSLYTGARQSELAQLKVDDVVQVENIWCLSITDTGINQNVKSKAAIRLVPIHKTLLAHGFIEYRNSIKLDGHKQLWPTLENRNNSWGTNVSRWFGESLKANSGITNHPSGARKVWHSFRHTFITKAMELNLPISHIQQIVGHEKSMIGETSTYTHLAIGQLSEVINRIEF